MLPSSHVCLSSLVDPTWKCLHDISKSVPHSCPRHFNYLLAYSHYIWWVSLWHFMHVYNVFDHTKPLSLPPPLLIFSFSFPTRWGIFFEIFLEFFLRISYMKLHNLYPNLSYLQLLPFCSDSLSNAWLLLVTYICTSVYINTAQNPHCPFSVAFIGSCMRQTSIKTIF